MTYMHDAALPKRHPRRDVAARVRRTAPATRGPSRIRFGRDQRLGS